MAGSSLSTVRLLGLLALLALGAGCLLVLRPFLSALLWSAILVYSTWPAFRWLRDRLGGRVGLAAGLLVAAEFLLLGLPLAFATPTSADDIAGLRRSVETLLTQGLPGFGEWIGTLPFVGGWLRGWWDGVGEGVGGLFELVRPYAGDLAQAALALLLALLSGLAEVLLALFLAFFLYRDGPAMATRLQAMLVRIGGEEARHLLELTGAVTRGVVFSLLGTAVAQGLLTTLGLWIAGVPRPLLLGMVAALVSVLPVGAPLVWVPAAIYLFAEGSTWWGVFMLVYGAAGISSADNVIRPWLIARGADLPILLSILGALGGVLAFGFLGLFLGPVLLAVGFNLLKDWADQPARGGIITASGLPPPRGPA